MRRYSALVLLFVAACTRPATVGSPSTPAPLTRAEQLLVVRTSDWNATTGTLRRYERTGRAAPWRAVGEPIAVVVGRSGLAWDDGTAGAPDGEPRKREGDGRAPAGIFPVDTAFGFASRASEVGTRLPYLPLLPTHECVDDGSSAHYNTTVDRATVPRVDWGSSEKMRSISLYRLGVMVGYNRPPRAGRGSCIFLHVWDGPNSVTAGCTAMEESQLRTVVQWLDPARSPVLVQLTDGAYERRRASWALP